MFIFGEADNRIQMFNGDTFFIAFFLVNKIVEFGNIAIAVQQNTVRGQTVAPGTPDLLVVAFDAFRQVVVNYKTDVRLVDTHAKGNRCDNNLHIIANEGFLVFASFDIVQPCMIRTDGVAPFCEVNGKFIHLLA